MTIFKTVIFLATFNLLRSSELILEWMLHELLPHSWLACIKVKCPFSRFFAYGPGARTDLDLGDV